MTQGPLKLPFSNFFGNGSFPLSIYLETRLSASHNIPDIQTETLPAISIIGICAAALRGMRPVTRGSAKVSICRW